MTTQTFIEQLVIESCVTCGTSFGVTAALREARINDHKNFWCPNGHSQHYLGKTDAERLREELEWERQRGDRLANEAAHARNQVRAQKAAKTRMKNRIANGVCPCCQRSFPDLHQHMSTQHPDFTNRDE